MYSLIFILFKSSKQEFFERKRQLKGNTRTPVPKRTDKTTAKASQDLFSLEVIMSAHKKDIKQKKGNKLLMKENNMAVSVSITL